MSLRLWVTRAHLCPVSFRGQPCCLASVLCTSICLSPSLRRRSDAQQIHIMPSFASGIGHRGFGCGCSSLFPSCPPFLLSVQSYILSLTNMFNMNTFNINLHVHCAEMYKAKSCTSPPNTSLALRGDQALLTICYLFYDHEWMNIIHKIFFVFAEKPHDTLHVVLQSAFLPYCRARQSAAIWPPRRPDSGGDGWGGLFEGPWNRLGKYQGSRVRGTKTGFFLPRRVPDRPAFGSGHLGVLFLCCHTQIPSSQKSVQPDARVLWAPRVGHELDAGVLKVRWSWGRRCLANASALGRRVQCLVSGMWVTMTGTSKEASLFSSYFNGSMVLRVKERTVLQPLGWADSRWSNGLISSLCFLRGKAAWLGKRRVCPEGGWSTVKLCSWRRKLCCRIYKAL